MSKKKKQCVICKSKFDLQRHHPTHTHLNHQEKVEKHLPTIVLCATCHYEVDFSKRMRCYEKAMMKRYEKLMKELEDHFGLQ